VSNRRPNAPGKPSKATIQKRAAAQRALAAASGAKAERRRRLLMVLSPIAVVILVIVVFVAVKAATGSGGPSSGEKAKSANSQVITNVTTVPAATFDAVGAGTVSALPNAISAPALTADGKPRVLYVGAEFCPYCATERWAVVAALARFGTWHNLSVTTSAGAPEVYPKTATLTFHGASYTSKYISFTGVEQQSNQVQGNSYAPLDKLSAADEKILNTYDAAPYVPSGSAGSIPFIDVGGKYVQVGASYDPGVLQGKSHAQISAAMRDPSSANAKGAVGAANTLTATVCSITDNKPANVCTSAGVTAAAKKLPAAKNSGNAG
jgi:hypothetical protein